MTPSLSARPIMATIVITVESEWLILLHIYVWYTYGAYITDIYTFI